MAVDVKQAVATAIQYLAGLLLAARDIRLEEVEIVDPTPSSPVELWQITLSFELETDPEEVYAVAGLLSHARMPRRIRYFRILTVESDTGRVRSMKIRPKVSDAA